MLASTLKLRPRYFFIVLAFAGDSTITRFMLPLVTVPFCDFAAVVALPAELRVEEARDAVFFVVLRVVLFVVVPPVFFVVVAITSSLNSIAH